MQLNGMDVLAYFFSARADSLSQSLALRGWYLGDFPSTVGICVLVNDERCAELN